MIGRHINIYCRRCVLMQLNENIPTNRGGRVIITLVLLRSQRGQTLGRQLCKRTWCIFHDPYHLHVYSFRLNVSHTFLIVHIYIDLPAYLSRLRSIIDHHRIIDALAMRFDVERFELESNHVTRHYFDGPRAIEVIWVEIGVVGRFNVAVGTLQLAATI